MKVFAFAAVALLACGKQEPAVAEAAPAPVVSASAKPMLHAQNVCRVDEANGTALLHALIPVTWKGGDAGDSEDKLLWSIRCDSKEAVCEGVRVDVKRIEERSGEVRPLNVTVLRTMKLLSLKGTTAVFEYDISSTITVDATEGRVRFTSSSKRGEGRGEVSCSAVVPAEFVMP